MLYYVTCYDTLGAESEFRDFQGFIHQNKEIEKKLRKSFKIMKEVVFENDIIRFVPPTVTKRMREQHALNASDVSEMSIKEFKNACQNYIKETKELGGV